MPQLPEWLSRLQKNARDKEYRLRRKGVTPERVRAISPRVDAMQVRRMGAEEQQAYALQLQVFNSRSNSLTVGGNSAKLPPWLSRLQKNTRNKEYRLRRQGADPSQVAAASPRVSAREVARMTPAEQRAYGIRLQSFNSVDNRYYVYRRTNALIEYNTARQLDALQSRYNASMAARERRIDAATAGTPIRTRFGDVETAIRERGGSLRARSGAQIGGAQVAGAVRRVDMTPRSQEEAERRIRTLERMNDPMQEVEKRELVRENYRKMLYLMGLNDVADRLQYLTPMQLDVLTVVTNFSELVVTPFDSKDYDEYLRTMYTNEELAQMQQLQRVSEDRHAQMNSLIDLVMDSIR